MYRKLFILSFICIVLASCEREFEIRDLDGGPKFYIESVFRNDQDMVDILVMPTRYIAEKPVEVSVPEGMTLKVKVDGEEVEVKKLEGMTDYDSYAKFRWSVEGGFQPGSEIEISAEADGYPKAASTVRIPEPFNDFTCKVEKVGADESLLHIDYKDDPESDDYFAVTVIRNVRCVRFDGTVDTEASYPIINFRSSDDFGDYPYTHINLPGENWPEFFNLVFWNDSRATDAQGMQRFSIYISEMHSEEAREYTEPTLGGSGEVIGTIYCRDYVTVYRLAPETYRYLNGLWNEDYNDLAHLGMAPPTFAYTNITGGIGAFVPMTSSEPQKIEWYKTGSDSI